MEKYANPTITVMAGRAIAPLPAMSGERGQAPYNAVAVPPRAALAFGFLFRLAGAVVSG